MKRYIRAVEGASEIVKMSKGLSVIGLINANFSLDIDLRSVPTCQKQGRYHWTVIIKRLPHGSVTVAGRITTSLRMSIMPKIKDAMNQNSLCKGDKGFLWEFQR